MDAAGDANTGISRNNFPYKILDDVNFFINLQEHIMLFYGKGPHTDSLRTDEGLSAFGICQQRVANEGWDVPAIFRL